MRTLVTEYKRMFFEKKIIWLLITTVIYVTVCSLFWNLRTKLDYDYVELHYNILAFKLWKETIQESYMTALLKIIPCMVFVFSFMDDRKNGIDSQICMRNHSDIYYMTKYIVAITGGMLYNFLSVIVIYIPLYFLLSTGNDGWNYLDREGALVGKFFTGSTAVEFVLIIAVGYAFVGGVCVAMSYVISMWIDNRVLVCIIPYTIFQILPSVFLIMDLYTKSETLSNIIHGIILGDIDVHMNDFTFSYSIYYFVGWILLLSILLIVSYKIRVKNKR